MKLYPNKSLEGNYKEWLQSINDDAEFFAEAWTKVAKDEFPTPEKSFILLGQMELEIHTSHTPDIEGTVGNLSQTVFQDARKQLSDEAQKQKWRN
jgi:hypothetical protein